MHSKLMALMEAGTKERVFPGGVLWVGKEGETAHYSIHGKQSIIPMGPKVKKDTCFDLASLTKVLATTGLVLKLIQGGKLSLSNKVSEIIPKYEGKGRENVTILHLLEHSSGLAAWRSYYQEVAAAHGGSWIASQKGRDAVRSMVFEELPERTPGSRASYSDLGFILLDWIIERISKKKTDILFYEKISKPLNLKNIFFVDLKSSVKTRTARKNKKIAATEFCTWRGRTLVGEVHDENTYVMGGISGHSGLFGTAGDVAKIAFAWLDSYYNRKGLFDQDLVKLFWSPSRVAGSSRALGFDRPAVKNSSAGRRLGALSVGHTGYTGTSLWIDPEKALMVVLLTNRIHPTRENQKIRNFRPRLHDLVVECLGKRLVMLGSKGKMVRL